MVVSPDGVSNGFVAENTPDPPSDRVKLPDALSQPSFWIVPVYVMDATGKIPLQGVYGEGLLAVQVKVVKPLYPGPPKYLGIDPGNLLGPSRATKR